MIIIKNFLNPMKIILITFLLIVSVYGAGELDPSFNAAAYGTTNGTINVVKKQPDGKIIIGGYFSTANNSAATGIARLNIDGSVDNSFNTQNLFASLGIGASINSIAVQTDGKILVGGYFYSPSGIAQPGLRRINADGSIDSSFTTFTLFGGAIYDIEIQSDNKILIGGEFTGPNATQNIARLNSNGTVDTTFASISGVTFIDLEIQPDGKVIAGGLFTGNAASGIIRRLTANGAIDNTFATLTVNGRIDAVKLKPNGQILIGGIFTSVNGFTQGRIAQINSDGSIDLTFNQNNPGISGNFSIDVYDIELRGDGKIVVGGRFLTYNGTSRKNLAQLNADGSLDTSFQDNTILLNSSTLYDLEIFPDGKVVAGTSFSDYPLSVVRFNTDGSQDLGFAPIFSLAGRVRNILQQSDGKILIGGEFPYVNGVKRNGLARLNADGSIDTTFVPYFNNAVARTITAFAVQSDGKILVSMAFVDQVFRLNTDGTQDTTFTTLFFGAANDIVVLTNGQILIGGGFGVKRLNANGSNDATFATTQPNGAVNKILVQPDGKILIGGAFTQIGANIRGRIARLNAADGTLDNTFNPPGGANNTVIDMDLQSDGKIILGGDFTSLNGSDHLRVGRLFSDGFLDNSFAQSADGTVRAVKLQSDGKVIIGGSFAFVQNQLHVGLARLNSNGSLDSSFTAAPNTSVYDIALQTDNKVLIGGEFILVNGNSAVKVARLLNTIAPPKTLFDYDGDGRADVSVFRPSTNRWYEYLSGNNAVVEQTFGLSGDVLAPADYDGDGKTDIAIFRPATGDWWYLSSINNAQVQNHWGGSGDIPRPSDFDGDGKADFVVFRPAENNWYRFGSTGAVSIINFGLAGDKPVTGDFDGDGKSDVAIYRPSTGTWWYRSSINNAQIATQFGISSDFPSAADFDGDGKTDFAV
ncbi:hypothetical protein BH10ACI1_BH10ACI1_09630 [soil metagenome]